MAPLLSYMLNRSNYEVEFMDIKDILVRGNSVILNLFINTLLVFFK